jgi:flagellar protein FlaG
MENDTLGKTKATLASLGLGPSSASGAQQSATAAAVSAPNAAALNLTTQKATVLMDADRQHQQLTAAIDNLNRMMKEGSRNLTFAMDNVLGGPIVVVKDSSTGEVIRQLPNEVVVRMAHEIADFKGKLHNSSV